MGNFGLTLKDIWNSPSWFSLVRGLIIFLSGLCLVVFKDELSSVSPYYYSLMTNTFIIAISLMFYASDLLIAVYDLLTFDYKVALINVINLNNETVNKIKDNDDVPQYLKNQLDDHIIEESSIL